MHLLMKLMLLLSFYIHYIHKLPNPVSRTIWNKGERFFETRPSKSHHSSKSALDPCDGENAVPTPAVQNQSRQ